MKCNGCSQASANVFLLHLQSNYWSAAWNKNCWEKCFLNFVSFVSTIQPVTTLICFKGFDDKRPILWRSNFSLFQTKFFAGINFVVVAVVGVVVVWACWSCRCWHCRHHVDDVVVIVVVVILLLLLLSSFCCCCCCRHFVVAVVAVIALLQLLFFALSLLISLMLLLLLSSSWICIFLLLRSR